jgi:hypothetical protein
MPPLPHCTTFHRPSVAAAQSPSIAGDVICRTPNSPTPNSASSPPPLYHRPMTQRHPYHRVVPPVSSPSLLGDVAAPQPPHSATAIGLACQESHSHATAVKTFCFFFPASAWLGWTVTGLAILRDIKSPCFMRAGFAWCTTLSLTRGGQACMPATQCHQAVRQGIRFRFMNGLLHGSDSQHGP